MNIGLASLRCQARRPGGSSPLVAIARLTIGPPCRKPFWKGWRVLRTSYSSLPDDRVLDRLLVGLEARFAARERRVDRLGGEHARLDRSGARPSARPCRPCRRRRRRAAHPASTASASTSSRRPGAPWRPTRRARRPRGCPLTSGWVLNCCSRSCAEVVASAYSRSITKPIETRSSPRLLVLHRVDPGAADLPVLGRDLQRPRADRVDQAVERLGDLPDLLDAELPDLRLAILGEVELADRGAGQVPPAALGEHRRLRLDVGARLEVAERLAVLAATLVAGAHADHAPVLDDQLRRRGLGEDVGAGLLGLALLKARQRRDRDDLVAVVLERRRRRDAHASSWPSASGRPPPW